MKNQAKRVSKKLSGIKTKKKNFFSYSIKMSGKTLDKFKHSDKGFKYFVVYADDDIIRLLSIILPQINEYKESC